MDLKIFDTHAHYDDEKFDEDREEILAAVHAQGVELILDPGCDLKSSFLAREIAAKHSFVYFAAGIHPEELDEIPDDYISQLRKLAADEKCAAIGEIGLDYYWDSSRKDLQKEIFRAQLELALELRKPVIIHDRDAHGDCLEIVNEFFSLSDPEASPGVFHCFSGSAEMARELLKKGWYLGFDGPVTYKNARKALEVLEIVPADRILAETDSPYLSPIPHRGERNTSANLIHVLEKIAEVKGISTMEAAEITYANAVRLFFNRDRQET